MSGGSGKSREIVLGDELGDIAVKANGVRVEIRTDGSVVAYTKSDVDAFTNGAVHIHPAVDGDGEPAAKAERKPGDRMPDGSIYAGVSPDTRKPMYTTPHDLYFVYFQEEADLTFTFKEAAKYASKLDAHGHQDWRVPTKGELNVLYNNRAAIGGFNVSGSYPAGWYWSSSQNYYFGAWDQRFSVGNQSTNDRLNDSSLRCVR